MFQDLDDTLKELLIQKVPIDPQAIDIKFDMPDKDWEGKVTRPTINLFLYDIRENHELRSNESMLSRNGTTGTETKAPIRMDLSYMITVWTKKDVADEHTEHFLLGTVLKALLRYPILPTEVFKGDIIHQPLPVRAWVTQPDRTPNAWDFWSAIDGRLKAGISYVVTIAIEPFSAVEVGLVTEKVLSVELIPEHSSN
ncbi:DUF4255 domain-containing protein [Pantanalinema rosaneae CENA516]|uniref:DUF4255 domain-containing protein n=1 Tax=Pantanalinema rosaneae TaxID=1620701 RepID=UPI003D6FA605